MFFYFNNNNNKEKEKMKNKKYWMGAFIAFCVDLFTKIWALHYLELEEEFLINPYFSIQRVWNESNILASVSFDIPNFLFRFFWVSFALILAIAIYWVSIQPTMNEENNKTDFAKTGLFLIMSGIWGNCFDRIFRSDGVIDFIRLNFMKDSIPIMNFADVFIYMGIFSIIIGWLLIFTDLFKNKLCNKKVA